MTPGGLGNAVTKDPDEHFLNKGESTTCHAVSNPCLSGLPSAFSCRRVIPAKIAKPTSLTAWRHTLSYTRPSYSNTPYSQGNGTVTTDEHPRARSQQSSLVIGQSSSTNWPGPTLPVGKSEDPSPNNETYIGRAHYLDHDTPFDETQARDVAVPQRRQPSESENAVLQLFNAFELPPRAVFRSLLDSFLTYCQPWTPVLTRGDIDLGGQQALSYLICQSMFVAASRVSTAPSTRSFATTDQFYQRAKALFFMNHELDALAVIKATIMLQWYTPVGPEQVSYDAGEFWLRVGVAIAFQIGLHRESPPGPTAAARRRIWWTLRTRDACMTVAHGRPRAINPDDTDVGPIRPEDLVDAAGRGDGQLFAAYTNICSILGEISETCSRNTMTLAKHQNFETLLQEWPSQIPEHLRFPKFGVSTERYMSLQSQLNLRQLHLPYLLSLAIIGRSLKRETISAQPVIAASFVAGIFRDFLARDEIKHLAPIFSRYCIASGFFLALLQPLTEVWAACQSDMDVFRKSLEELGQRWKSAKSGLRALEHFISLREKQPQRAVQKVVWLTDHQRRFFDCFPRDYCLSWAPLYEHCRLNPAGQDHVDGNATTHTNVPLVDTSVVDRVSEDQWAFNDADFEQFMWTNTEDWFSNI
ncbi:hypothetical protein AYO22_01929 [Fonsecaea multimorphosa]|nr:hypothetical protein AYO22_01929 [Fonsecaea multimorphosa]